MNKMLYLLLMLGFLWISGCAQDSEDDFFVGERTTGLSQTERSSTNSSNLRYNSEASGYVDDSRQGKKTIESSSRDDGLGWHSVITEPDGGQRVDEGNYSTQPYTQSR